MTEENNSHRDLKEQVEIYIQGGITKNAGELDLLKVQAIYIIPAMKDSKFRQKKQQEEKMERQPKRFATCLQQAKKEVSKESVTCKTNGYTRDAKAFTYQYESKEYND